MDEMILQFSSTLSSDRFEKNSHCELYKIRGTAKSAQENRRMMILNAQKEKRNAIIDSARGLLDLIKQSDQSKQTEKIYKPKVHVPGFTTKKQYYNDKLMLSEWMTECPKDLSKNWCALACPKGTRVLIVAAKGCTKAYTKQGYTFKSWQSLLPGGNSCEENYNKYCVLDGVWNPQTASLYILDLLVWGTQSMTECELEFRSYWLRTKFSEIPGLKIVSNHNKFPIHLIEKHQCTVESLNNFMMMWPAYPNNLPEVDGILFYHKNAFYVSGTTPLVVWLYPFMINEVLGSDISVHLSYQAEKPDDYVDQKSFIEEFDKKQKERVSAVKKNYVRRRVRSFSSVTINSSFSGSEGADNSASGGKALMVFGEDNSKPKSKESEDVLISSTKNKRDRKMKSKMDVDQNDSVNIDSAVSSMDESIEVTNESFNETSSFSVTDELECD